MKVRNCKYALLCGTLFLCLLGSVPQMKAAKPDHSEITQKDNKVTGTVKDDLGPIVGASVVEKGTTNGTMTDTDGKFSLNVQSGATLVISYIGFKTQEVKAGNTPLDITLEEDSKMLDDVVVTALGIKRERKALGYGVDEVKGDALTKAKETNVINSMAGRVAGLVVSQTAGGPSGSTRVILRGSTEMTGNNQPLYVIDGVPLDNTNYGSAGTAGGFDLGDGISSINADDIENMSVLKGPAASALYGSRASHGVILITTKKAGEKDKYSIEYNGTLTFDTQLAKWNDIQQTYGMGSNGTYSIDAVSNTNKSWGPKADGSNMLRYFDGVERPYLIIPDNTSDFFRTGLTATNTAIVNTNSGNTGVRFTYTDMRNKDIVPKTHMSRDIFNLRTNTTLSKVDLDFSANYTREDVKNRPALGDSKSNIGKNLMTLATTYDQEWLKTYQDANGEYSNWNGMDPYNVNPYWDVYKNSNSSKKDQFRFNGKVLWNINKHLKLQGTAGTELNWFAFEDYKAPTTPGFEAGRLQISNFRNRMYNFEVLALYNNRWGDFDLNATLGGNVYKVNNQTTVTTAQDMQIRDVVTLMSFNEISVEPNSYRKQINSAYGAVNVGWKHMLYLDATLRGDQSSTLPIGNNVYVYPSFSGSFVFSELTKMDNIMPYGKLRMSWAQVGSDTDPYQLGLVYTKSKYAYPGYTIGYINNNTIPNQKLKPTKTNSFEIGLETKFLKNRVGLDFTYYTQNSKNQIMGMASSWTTGYTSRLINAGEIENRGIEIVLNTRPVEVKDFSWDLNLNFSKNSNKVKKLVDDMDMFELEKAAWLDVQVAAKVGENFGSIIGPDFKRNDNGDILIDPQTGLPQYDKSNHVLGNASWDWTGGLLTTFTYKNLSLSAVFDVKVGADLYSMSARASYESGKSKETLEGREGWYKSEEQRQAAGIAKGSSSWNPTGGFIAPGVIDNGDGTYRENNIYINPEDYWMSVSRNAPSMFIYDNSYVKCREITMSYNVPKPWLKNVVKGLTLSFVARNPFIVWKNIPNIDPDSNYNNTTGMGLEYGSLPSRKSYGFNVNVKF
ncbi:TonB-linked SusC/RagA family outer membrane protein [Dysgonomonas sp. PFB1-18]|uniref:SusC/RagA family TonB-linked outer membrane protein n=1 Tax=unclassified Dysgonomonas TaxID=2630389 RepID=UPI0024766C7D|nr:MULTISPECIES: SusC/RagA family TonB-linked outer membrane protein [unclassified Dysgonomonas]MDH6309502.1 TonB-linked SusC/RagA family outer membrane protein [Dysgonomonas sp. PF1-14]MDH6339170.1 TonB-linked SusC/RagA family outer membrane protein [Dysgonomonas sp. PF1-16]MDH6380543.1 TonB-linked SusC/RagA family outer membrane protein [Dysgonomonas sp. PFB1-18]MDH6398039.1 TonB-linked SusC/RagA family outer membrane protein [Dysgonomonas sp. PF1-23]